MKIEIQYNDLSGVSDYQIYDNTNKRYLTKSGMFPRNFDESYFQIILSDSQYNGFLKGKYEFDVTGKKLALFDDYYLTPKCYNDNDWLKEKAEIK